LSQQGTETLSEIRAMLADLLGRPVEDVLAKHDLVADLHIDSLTIIHIMIGIEERYSITLEFGDLLDSTTVGDFAHVVAIRRGWSGA
jgi:acyl carrier protein